MAQLTPDDIILANKIAQRIKYLREQSCGPRQADFVRKYNIEKQLISRWENPIQVDMETGEIRGRGITIYTINTFCTAIGISLQEFFNDDIFRTK